MSRGNVFKLSSNQILSGNNNEYQNPGFDDIKNSLKLLKAKKNQKQNSETQSYGYGGASTQIPTTKNYTPTRNQYNYDMLSKNHIPTSQKEFGNNDYKNDNYQAKNYPSYGGSRDTGNQKYREEQEYGNKPATYSHENGARNSRNVKNQANEPKQYQNYNQYEDIQPTRKPPQNSKVNKPEPRVPQKKNTQDSYNNKKNYQNQYYNDKEQRSIKEVNRENQVDIIEYDPSTLRQCRMGCGRKFNPDSLAVHQRNCKKVFQKKRKEFNAQEHRIIDKQQPKLIKKGQRIEQKIQQQKKNEKIPKWKAQSLAFRAAMLENRGGQLSHQDMQMMKQVKQVQSQAGVVCKFCGRKFNDQAGQRHIVFCQQQNKKNAMKKKK